MKNEKRSTTRYVADVSYTFSPEGVSKVLGGVGIAFAQTQPKRILLVPYVISAVATAYIWRWLFHSDFGVIGAISVALGVTDHPINFLDDRSAVIKSSRTKRAPAAQPGHSPEATSGKSSMATNNLSATGSRSEPSMVGPSRRASQPSTKSVAPTSVPNTNAIHIHG